MTLPEQSDRAVAATREFLVRLSSPFVEDGIKGVRREVRAEALRLLRHYPYVWLSQNGDCPVPDNAANADNTPATHDTPTEGSVQSGCTLTDEEREAIEAAAKIVDAYDEEMDGFSSGAAATLRGLLERLK